jgi:hypothetical protein
MVLREGPVDVHGVGELAENDEQDAHDEHHEEKHDAALPPPRPV